MSSLLVVDWDYFFRNPMEAGDTNDPAYFMYDWGHAESKLFIDGSIIWPSRAHGFWRNDLPLPGVDVPPGWWGRFDIDPDATLFVADSNAYAGSVSDSEGEPFEDVWLYDAHHDLFKIQTEAELADWAEQGEYSCENWMFRHLLDGADLHWRWPHWLHRGPKIVDTVPDWIELDAAEDTEPPPNTVCFDTVFVCRSGAWVPPWCDEQFVEFVDQAPTRTTVQMDDESLVRAEWKEAAEAHAAAMDAAWKQITSEATP